jgi:hypothetical protein
MYFEKDEPSAELETEASKIEKVLKGPAAKEVLM